MPPDTSQSPVNSPHDSTVEGSLAVSRPEAGIGATDASGLATGQDEGGLSTRASLHRSSHHSSSVESRSLKPCHVGIHDVDGDLDGTPDPPPRVTQTVYGSGTGASSDGTVATSLVPFRLLSRLAASTRWRPSWSVSRSGRCAQSSILRPRQGLREWRFRRRCAQCADRRHTANMRSTGSSPSQVDSIRRERMHLARARPSSRRASARPPATMWD